MWYSQANGMQFSHQSFFVRSIDHKSRRFNLRYKYSADFDFIYWLYKNNYKLFAVDEIISILSPLGVTGRHEIASTFERWLIIGFRNLRMNVYYAILLLKIILVQTLLSIIGEHVTSSLINQKRRLFSFWKSKCGN